MRITFVARKFGNVERNSHCDVLHITPVRVIRLFLDCNGVFAIKAYDRSVSDGSVALNHDRTYLRRWFIQVNSRAGDSVFTIVCGCFSRTYKNV